MANRGQTRNPGEIEADLDRTRDRLGDTLEALHRKLSPHEMLDQARGYVGSGGGEFASNFRRSVTQNPIPVGLVGAGLAWLMMSGRTDSAGATGRRTRAYGDVKAGSDPANLPTAYSLGEADAEIGIEGQEGARPADFQAQARGGTSATDKASAAVGGVRGKVGGTARRFGTGVRGVASGGRSRVQGLAHGARGGASRMTDMGRHGAERVTSGFEHMLHEQPLVLGALGIALGAALAAGLPTTRREDELMGEARDTLMSRAREKGHEQMDKAGRVAESAQAAALQEAEREGLTREAAGEQLQETYEKVKRVSTAAKGAAKEEARNRPS